jgi:hypothetical protein
MFYQEYIFIIHLLLIGPALIIIGKYHDHPKIKNNKTIWNMMILMGLSVVVYHVLKWYQFRINIG